MKEITLTDSCPGCYLEGLGDNPLKAQPGGFVGTYCIRPGSTTDEKGHIYGDTGEMRDEIKKAEKQRKAKAKDEAKKTAKPSESPEPEGRVALDEENPAPISTIEPKAFEVTEIDAERLSELLGQVITDGGTLVGACYSLKMTAATEQGIAERRAASIANTGTDLTIEQKSDGSLMVQIFLPWLTGKAMVEKAIFSNETLQNVTQNMLEFTMAGNSFPWNVESSGAVAPPYDGFWMIVQVPELYVGTLLDKAVELSMSPTQYLQAFIFDMIGTEQFV